MSRTTATVRLLGSQVDRCWPAFILLIGLLGCERPFVEERTPVIEILEPDQTQVSRVPKVMLRVGVESRNEIDSVTVNGLAMTIDQTAGDEFVRELNLRRGLNQFFVEAVDSGGNVGIDTVSLAFLLYDFEIAPFRLPEGRGGHTASLLSTGQLLVIGGSELPNQPAGSTAFLFQAVDPDGPPDRLEMPRGRTEHTATLLGDGRVLVIGGSKIPEPDDVTQLVEAVEIYDPTSRSFIDVPVVGDPVRRSGHVTILFRTRGPAGIQNFLYLYGGFGDIQYRPPRMGIRSDLRVFQFRNDSLIAAGPTFGPFIDAIADHFVAQLSPSTGASAQYLIGGSFFAAEDLFDTILFEADISTSTGIRIRDTGPLEIPRSGAASETLTIDEVMIFGGRGFSFTSATASTEVYYGRADATFRFPDGNVLLQERWGHSATIWTEDRILIVGGFGRTGAATTTSEWFSVDSSNQ